MTSNGMDTHTPNIELYFKRLKMQPPQTPSLDSLQQILRAHVCYVPFENIDVLLDKDINLDLQSLEQKILLQGRGGYCFEINSLFAALLTALHFQVTTHTGRVYFGREDGHERPRTHMVLLVQLEGETWLTDATFGALGFTQPFCVSNPNHLQNPPNLRVRKQPSNNQFLLQSKLSGKWQDLYVFDDTIALPIDYEVANFYTSKHPRSAFRKNLLAMRCDPESGATHIVRNKAYLHTVNGISKSTRVESKKDLLDILNQRIGLNPTLEELNFFDTLPSSKA